MYATGTVRKGSKGFPASLAGFQATHPAPPRHTRGEMHRRREICALVWMDSRPVWLLSTAVNPIDPKCVAQRWIHRERVEFPTSPVLLQYQANMRGIDVCDQTRGYYTTMMASHKWWHKILTFVLDSSIDNSWILYRHDAEDLGLATQSRLAWHYNLAQQLVAPFVKPNIPRGRFRNLARRGFHYSERHECLRRKCFVCGSRTRTFCGGCSGRFMCMKPCYVKVHTQPEYAAMAFTR